MKHTLPIIALVIALASCGSDTTEHEQANSTDSTIIPVSTTTTVTPIVTQPVDDSTVVDNPQTNNNGKVIAQSGDNTRFMVSFISQGTGIDHDSKKKFDIWLKTRTDVKYTASPWGREGEVSYCFWMQEKSASEQEAFIRDAKNQLTKRELVMFSENVPCEKRR